MYGSQGKSSISQITTSLFPLCNSLLMISNSPSVIYTTELAIKSVNYPISAHTRVVSENGKLDFGSPAFISLFFNSMSIIK